MGIFNFIVKRSGKVTGTTRWIAEYYKALLKDNPQMSYIEVLRIINSARCAGYKDQRIIDRLNKWVNDSEDIFLSKGLANYIYYMLQVESGMSEVPYEVFHVIVEELENAGIDRRVINSLYLNRA